MDHPYARRLDFFARRTRKYNRIAALREAKRSLCRASVGGDAFSTSETWCLKCLLYRRP